jgi:hypothetical protein
MWSDGSLNIVELSEFSKISLDQLSLRSGWADGGLFVL